MPKPKSPEERAQDLARRALDDLDSFDTRAARRKGEKLMAMGSTWGYEIVARAHQQDDRLDDAIATLQEGTRVAPQVWPLWQLLGNMLSDAGRFDEAETSYARALACPEVDRASVDLNRALVCWRLGEPGQALALLEACQDEVCARDELRLAHPAMKTAVLGDLERWADAESEARQALTRVTEEDREERGEEVARLHGGLAKALWRGFGRREEALAEAWVAIEGGDEVAMAVVREIEGRRSSSAHRFRLTVRGRWHEPIEGDEAAPGFFRNYEVVAASVDEALAAVTRFEPEAVRDSLAVEDSEVLEPAPEAELGVYNRTGYILFSEEEED